MFYLRNIWGIYLSQFILVPILWPISGLSLAGSVTHDLTTSSWDCSLQTLWDGCRPMAHHPDIHSDTVHWDHWGIFFGHLRNRPILFRHFPYSFHTLSIVFSGFSQRRRHPRGPRCQDPWRCCRVWEMTRSSRNPSIPGVSEILKKWALQISPFQLISQQAPTRLLFYVSFIVLGLRMLLFLRFFGCYWANPWCRELLKGPICPCKRLRWRYFCTDTLVHLWISKTVLYGFRWF